MKFTSLGFEDEKDEKQNLNKPVYLFGRDIKTIPCFRSSFLCGICCAAGGGLLCFLATSKTLFSTHMAFASLWIGVFAYWIPCRYRYETSHLMVDSLKNNSADCLSNQNDADQLSKNDS